MFVLIKAISDDAFERAKSAPGDIAVIKFEVPILIHTTVLPAQQDQDTLEVGIPKNAKLYINFLKPNLALQLKGRFSTDCLFETFAGVGLIDDNVHRKTVEVRHTLNMQMYKICIFLTYAFVFFGLMVFLKISFMGDRKIQPFHHHHKQGSQRNIKLGSQRNIQKATLDEDVRPLINKTDKKEKDD
jgi:hypothetical protein